MTKVHYYAATTLDGFLADPNDSLEWLLRQEIDAEGYGSYPGFIAGIGAIVMGTILSALKNNLRQRRRWQAR